MRRTVLLALLVSLPWAVPAIAQDPNTPVSSDAAAAPAAVPVTPGAAESPPYAGTQAYPLAERSQPPRTLRAYWHVFIAFAVTWLLLFGYAISLGRRWARLEREVLARQ
jgi:CcmD family protein